MRQYLLEAFGNPSSRDVAMMAECWASICQDSVAFNFTIGDDQFFLKTSSDRKADTPLLKPSRTGRERVSRPERSHRFHCAKRARPLPPASFIPSRKFSKVPGRAAKTSQSHRMCQSSSRSTTPRGACFCAADKSAAARCCCGTGQPHSTRTR
jgi:hypothetical protein